MISNLLPNETVLASLTAFAGVFACCTITVINKWYNLFKLCLTEEYFSDLLKVTIKRLFKIPKYQNATVSIHQHVNVLICIYICPS
jgi:hypothetical protein